MLNDQPHITIIILNWNGAKDTIECLETVLKSDYQKFNIIIIDNKSEDDSITRIQLWAQGNYREIFTRFTELVLPPVERPIHVSILKMEDTSHLHGFIQERLPHPPSVRSILLVENHQNSGFAGGNNLGMEIGGFLFKSKYYYILNNDTVIMKDAISTLVNELEKNNKIGAATSAIYRYNNPREIANLGGKITSYGNRKYYTKPTTERMKRITFVTGCALMVRRNIIEDMGLLSERFFFGEEDFDFSWRMKKKKIPMVCITSSKVYHKKGISSEKLMGQNLENKFHYVFNRIIDMKYHYSTVLWHFWRFFIFIYTFIWLSVKYHIPFFIVFRFIRELRRSTNRYEDAKKQTLDKVFSEMNTLF